MTTPRELPHPSTPISPLVLGVLALAGGALGVVGGGIGLLSTANSCGMFADHCATYGQAGTGADLFATIIMWSFGLGLLGVALLVVGAVSRPSPAHR